MSRSHQGYVGIPRLVLQLPIWSNPHEVGLYFYCLLSATHKPYRGLKPGQFYTSKDKLAKALGWSRSTVYKSLGALQEKNLLRELSSRQGTIITVNCWDELTSGQPIQPHILSFLGVRETQAEKDPIQAILEHGNCRGNVPDNNAFYGEDYGCMVDEFQPSQKHRTQDSEKLPYAGIEPREQDFEKFWCAYPRKMGKAAAKKRFCSMDVELNILLDALREAQNSMEWVTEYGRFIPSPEKWLDGCWEKYKPTELPDESEEWISR